MELLAIDENFLVPFAPPPFDGIHDRQRIANVDAAPLKRDVIPIGVRPRRHRVLASPVRMKVHARRIPFPIANGGRQIDLNIFVAQIQNRNLGVVLIRHHPATGHRAIGVDRAVPTLKRIQANATAKEVTNRAPNGFFVVKAHFQNDLSSHVRVVVVAKFQRQARTANVPSGNETSFSCPAAIVCLSSTNFCLRLNWQRATASDMFRRSAVLRI